MEDNKLPFVDDELRSEIRKIMECKNEADAIIEYNFDPQIVVDKIKHFRSLNTRNMTDDELFNAILETISVDGKSLLLAEIRSLPANSIFYRVRSINETKFPLSNFNKISDMWEPPAEVVSQMGRLNKPHESLLYVALADPNCAINECRIEDGHYFALIKYMGIRPIKFNYIGGKHDYQKHGISDKNTILIHELYSNFLADEFSRDVGKGTEFIYRISERIAKDYFDFPPELQDAWAYPSVFNKDNVNFCFRPEEAHELLSVQGALICKLDNGKIKPMVFVQPEETFQYYQVTEELMQKLFPEFTKA